MGDILDVGDEVTPFSLSSQMGSMRFREFIDGKWCLLVTIKMSLDPVATTEIGMISKMHDEFESRNMCVIVVCADSVTNIRKWIRDIEELQDCKVNIPIVSDPEMSVLKKYGVTKSLPPFYNLEIYSTGAFLIDTDKIIRLSMKYSPSIGKNFYELLRSYDALQLATYQKVVCPSNWCIGQDVFVDTSIANDEATRMLPKGFVEIKPWFRLTPAPDNI